MGFKNFRLQAIIRLILIIATVFLLVNLYYSEAYGFTKILVIVIIVFQIVSLFSHVNKTNREIVGFLQTIKYDDFSQTYSDHNEGSGFKELYKEFNEVIRKFRDVRADREAQYQYLKTIVQHVGIGIITFDELGEVQIMNASARNLLGVEQIKNVNQLQPIGNELIETIRDLRTGGRDLIKISRNGEEIQLAVYVIELSLRGKEFKLISLQNIQSELEEKEMEAWQNLIRVLTHEIMNSVTPISSLAATVETELDEFVKDGKNVSEISNEAVEDVHMAVKTIHNRSDSLIKFVSDFRNMTRIKHPTLKEVIIKDVLEHVIMLLKPDIEKNKIELHFKVEPADLKVNIDQEQIEQVLINLVKNGIQALEENDEDGKESKILRIEGSQKTEGGAAILIADNGTGIDEEAIKKIFIPFFTTKKNGSGIGLSLSKQIMRQHKGNISVQSTLNIGTEFLLKFSQ